MSDWGPRSDYSPAERKIIADGYRQPPIAWLLLCGTLVGVLFVAALGAGPWWSGAITGTGLSLAALLDYRYRGGGPPCRLSATRGGGRESDE